MNKFKLPIGDWSKDGHNQCDFFVVNSNVEFDVIVTAYMAMDEEYKLSDQCSEYENYKLTEQFMEFMRTKNLDPGDYAMDNDGSIDPAEMAQLLIDLMMKHDSELELTIIQDNEMPMLSNWAAGKGKHLSLPGYGLFE